MSVIRRKYGTATAAGSHIRVPMIKAGAQDFATSTDWAPASGDVKISKDGGAQANIGTLPTYSNGMWQFQLTATELTAKQVEIVVVDQGTKAVEDQSILIETYGNASAMQPFDVSQPMSAQAVASVSGAVGSVTGNVGGNVAGSVGSVSAAVTAGTVGDKSGYSLSTAGIDAILTRPMGESYAADGAPASLTQALYELLALFGEASVSGVTLTIHQRDGVSVAATYTLNDALNPTAITRTS